MDKPETMQMKYPAPYSQSWACPETQKKKKKAVKKIKKNSLLQEDVFVGCCRRKVALQRTSNPYAPHLKYGIFPQQAKLRSQMVTVDANSTARNSAEVSGQEVNKSEIKSSKREQLSEAPLFVIRPIDKGSRRQLSTSETLHLDIKPRTRLIQSPKKYILQR